MDIEDGEPPGPMSPVELVRYLERNRPLVRRMYWSLGAAGDLLWLTLPESREYLADLVRDELSGAVEQDRDLVPLSTTGIIRWALWNPLLEPALRGFPETGDQAVHYCAVVRELWDFEDPDRDRVRRGVVDVVFRRVFGSALEAVVAQVNPDLHVLVGEHGRG